MILHAVKATIYALLLVLVNGCGGGSDNQTSQPLPSIHEEPSEVTVETTQDNTSTPLNQTPQRLTIQGNIIADTAISAATLFWDINENGIQDEHEPHTLSDEEGHYQLELNKTVVEEQKILTLIASGGHESALNHAFEETLMSRSEYNATIHLTPLTTLIAQSIEEVGSKESKTLSKLSPQEIITKIEEMKEAFSRILNIAKTLLTADPIALANAGNRQLLKSNQKLYHITKEMKKAMKQEVRTNQQAILRNYRLLSRELRKANKHNDDAMILAVEEATQEESIFDTTLIPTLKNNTKTLLSQINTFWSHNQNRQVDPTLLRELIGNLEQSFNTDPIVSNPPRVDNYPYIPKDINQSVAIRFLNKATFGATKESIKALQSMGVEAWVNQQLALPLERDIYLKKTILLGKEAEPTRTPYSVEEYLAENEKIFNKEVASFHSPRFMQSAWFDTVLTAPDQLRQKLTYALSQIIVESDFEPIFTRRGEALSHYFDILAHNALGNYKQLLKDISFSSGMGLFLTYNGNKKSYQNEANITIYPDENYAREIMQLFSIGLNELNLDGSPKKDPNGNLIPTYTQEDVNELSRVFTGWDAQYSGAGDSNWGDKFGRVGFTRGDFTHPLEFTAKYHDNGEKTLLKQTIPAGLSGEEDINSAIDIIMSNGNVAPYISKNLIMRMTKSNPSPQYIQRVATLFKSTHGNLKEVIKAILLDPEIWDDIIHLRSVKFKEPLIAYTNYLRMANVKPLPYWYFCGYGGPNDENATNCQKVHNKFLFNTPIKYLGQGAGRAPSVFNFYDNGFIPNDTAFKNDAHVAPELQIEDDSMLINFNNTIRKTLDWDQTYMLTHKLSDGSRYPDIDTIIRNAPKDYNIPIYYVGADKYMLDLQEDYNFLEQQIDGDSNGDFINLKDNYQEGNQTIINRAVKMFIAYADNKLTGGLLSEEEREIIYHALTQHQIYNHWADDDTPFAKKRQLMDKVIRPTYRAIITSDKFMTE